MKKFFFAFMLVMFVLACGNNNTKKEEPKVVDITENPDYKKGVMLAEQNKCTTCHDIENTITGPPYRQVANKYAGRPDTIVNYLANKVISGGSGNWGEIPMTPHPGLSKEDAETLVRYILLLKK